MIKRLAVVVSVAICGLSFWSFALAQEDATVIGSMPASKFMIVEAAFQDFFLGRDDCDCFNIFVSESEEGLHVMFLRSEGASNQLNDRGESNSRGDRACGPGARYDYDHEGQLTRKTYIR